MNDHKHTNLLIHETSPYLLQHAGNPVNWRAWNEETLEMAKNEDKMILVSIGYSACHWCHVMEHESFEDEGVAEVMNAHFICIKVDREERPDVDQVYMDAVQMISGRGGWPLNCFAMPDGRPVWGGTYFQKEQWLEILDNIALLFKAERNKLEKQADEIYSGILKNAFMNPAPIQADSFDRKDTEVMTDLLINKIDWENGGFRGPPKFPMPNNLLFLLRSHYFVKNPEVLSAVTLTLEKIARGGIFDHIGGGFSRYSVDEHWHIPHFEKMLYDNAQLVSLYAEAYCQLQNPIFERVIIETLEFIERELTAPEGGFYAALDADSEGVEGKFYVWRKAEFEEVLGEDAKILIDYFGVDKEASWEDDNNVLVSAMSLDKLADQYKLPEVEVSKIVARGKLKLFEARSKRIHPGLDDKVLTSWNALMLKGYIDAYRVLGRKKYLDAAVRNATFLSREMIQKDGRVMRSFKNGVASIEGFLDDYSFLMEAFIALHELTFVDKWLQLAKQLAEYTIKHFYHKESGMFHYTSDIHNDTVVKTVEVTDNVIPASCSSLARALHLLSVLYEEPAYADLSSNMLRKMIPNLQRFPSAFSNWGILHHHLAYPFHTLVVTGPDSGVFLDELKTSYLPNVHFSGGATESEIPINMNRWDSEETRVFVCTGSECKLPVKSVSEALNLLRPIE